jgi:hypothetical protein
MTLLNPTSLPPAVRKDRYVVLPIDFEEAWKVCFDGLFVTRVGAERNHYFSDRHYWSVERINIVKIVNKDQEEWETHRTRGYRLPS